MIKLQQEEAIRRKKERERLRCEFRKQARIQNQIEKGIYKLTPEEKHQRKIEAQRRHRAKMKALLPPKEPKPVKAKVKLPKKTIKVKPVSKPKDMPRPRTPKSQPRIFKTLNVDMSTMIKVRIDHKTEIYIRPGQDIEQVKQRYLNRRP